LVFEIKSIDVVPEVVPTGSAAMSQYPRMVQCRLGQLLRHNTHVWCNGNWINC